jgi:signal peptidase I
MRRPQTIGDVIEILGLALAAIIIIGLAFGYQLVVLTTSSMAPAAPAGSLLIVSSQAPEDVEIDDMIVMRRNSSTLVTHRVVALQAPSQLRTPSGSPQILATTQGDANETPDPNPYQLEDDQRVVQMVIPSAGWLVLPIIDRTFLVLGLAALVGIGLVFGGRFLGRRSEETVGSGPLLLPSGLDDSQNRDFVNRQHSDLSAEGQVKS